VTINLGFTRPYILYKYLQIYLRENIFSKKHNFCHKLAEN
jgi:hypothetical protein